MWEAILNGLINKTGDENKHLGGGRKLLFKTV